MKYQKDDIKQFFVWMRNGIAFCYTWLLILILCYHYIFTIESVSTVLLLKLLITVSGAVLIFNILFLKILFKKMQFITRLSCFMVLLSIYEVICFYWIGIFQRTSAFKQMGIFIAIIMVLYIACICIYDRYSKKKGELYTKNLWEYQKARNQEHAGESE